MGYILTLSKGSSDNRDNTDEEQAAGGGGSATKNPWEPFETEMDWWFASWAIQEGIKLSSVDSALEIPGVSYIFLERVVELTCPAVQGEARALLPQLTRSPSTRGLSPRESGVAGTLGLIQGQTWREAPRPVPQHHPGHPCTAREPKAC